MAIAFAMLAAFCGLAVVYLVSRATISARDILWLSDGRPSIEQGEVYGMYLHRHRIHRLVGGLFGFVFAVVVGLRWYGSVSLGFGEGGPLADVLTCSLAGVLVGALSAETYRLTQSGSTTAIASLTERPTTHNPRLVAVARGLVVAGVALGVLIALTGHGTTSLIISIGGLLVALFAEATRTAIATRRRPALSEAAEIVDGNIRRFALRSVELLQFGAAALTFGWVVAKAQGITNDFVGLAQLVVVLASLLVAIVALRRGAPRPPNDWVPQTS